MRNKGDLIGSNRGSKRPILWLAGKEEKMSKKTKRKTNKTRKAKFRTSDPSHTVHNITNCTTDVILLIWDFNFVLLIF